MTSARNALFRNALLFLLISLLTFTVTGCSEDDEPTGPIDTTPPALGWEAVTPEIEGNHFSSGWFLDAQTGWLAGREGVVLYTEDGGENFIELPTISSNDINDIEFGSPDTGWVVGEAGSIQRTLDGGMSWRSAARIPTDDAILTIEAITSRKVTALTPDGLFLYSFDGGRLWNSDTVQNDRPLNDIVVADTIAVIVGADGSIFRSSGYNKEVSHYRIDSTWSGWIAVNSPVATDLNAVVTAGDGSVWAVGDSGAIIKSTDLGLNWIVVASGRDLDFVDIAATSTPDYLVAAASDGSIELIGMGGASLVTISRHDYDNVAALIPAGDTTMWAVGSLTLKKANTGWAVWTSVVSNRPPLPSLTDIQFVTEDIGYVVGFSGAILRTYDAGETWELIRRGSRFSPQEFYTAVSFFDASTGIVVGRAGLPPYNLLVLRTFDAGETWERLAFEDISWARSGAFVDSLTGYIVGDETVYATIDGGRTWEERKVPTTNELNTLWFFDAVTGVVGGTAGTVFTTTDGGQMWTDRSADTLLGRIYNIFFTELAAGYAVGDGALLWKTSDSGKTWTALTAPITSGLLDLHFISADTGWVIGEGGTVIRTNDGGMTWTEQATPTMLSLTGICFCNPDRGWIVGADGTLLMTTTGGEAPE